MFGPETPTIQVNLNENREKFQGNNSTIKTGKITQLTDWLAGFLFRRKFR